MVLCGPAGLKVLEAVARQNQTYGDYKLLIVALSSGHGNP
jgi:hypothetical protein